MLQPGIQGPPPAKTKLNWRNWVKWPVKALRSLIWYHSLPVFPTAVWLLCDIHQACLALSRIWFLQLCCQKSCLPVKALRPLPIPQPDRILLSTSWTAFFTVFSVKVPLPWRGKDCYSDNSIHPSALGKVFPKPAFKLFLSWFPLSDLNFHAQLDSQLGFHTFLVLIWSYQIFVPKCVLVFLAPGENVCVCVCVDATILTNLSTSSQFPESFTPVAITTSQATVLQLPIEHHWSGFSLCVTSST